jgi:hypothetical protein
VVALPEPLDFATATVGGRDLIRVMTNLVAGLVQCHEMSALLVEVGEVLVDCVPIDREIVQRLCLCFDARPVGFFFLFAQMVVSLRGET